MAADAFVSRIHEDHTDLNWEFNAFSASPPPQEDESEPGQQQELSRTKEECCSTGNSGSRLLTYNVQLTTQEEAHLWRAGLRSTPYGTLLIKGLSQI